MVRSRNRQGLIELLNKTAARIQKGGNYQWTHQGSCNCGHLAQTLTGLTSTEIHEIALSSEGEWRDHAEAYCETSQQPVDRLIRQMLDWGVSIEELGDLEYLRSDRVTPYLPKNRRQLDHKNRDDVILYFQTWALVLSAENHIAHNPDATVLIHGTPFKPYQTPLMPIDENPAAGLKVA